MHLAHFCSNMANFIFERLCQAVGKWRGSVQAECHRKWMWLISELDHISTIVTVALLSRLSYSMSACI